MKIKDVTLEEVLLNKCDNKDRMTLFFTNKEGLAFGIDVSKDENLEVLQIFQNEARLVEINTDYPFEDYISELEFTRLIKKDYEKVYFRDK